MTRFAALLACVLSTGTARAAEPLVVVGDSSHQLFLDTRLVQSSTNAELRLGVVQKDRANPLLPADRPWENATNNLYPNVQWDPDAKRFRVWYKCVVHDADAIARMKNPRTVHEQGRYLLHAESADGAT